MSMYLEIIYNNFERAKEILEEHPEFINDSNTFGSTPIMSVIYNKNAEMVDYFLEKGADLNKCAEGGNTVLNLAWKNGDVELVKRIMDLGFDINLKTKEEKFVVVDILQGPYFKEKKKEFLNIISSYQHLMNEELKKEYNKYRLRILLN